MRCRLRGVPWEIRWQKITSEDGWIGYCTNPSTHNRHITIDPDIEGREELDVLIHEMVHACLWDLKEDAVDETADSISRVLWRLGYRKPDPRNER